MAMNETILKILRDYGDGKITIEEANEKLAAAGSNVHLDPNKPGNAMLDTGTGTLDPVTVVDGKLTHPAGIPRQDEVIYDGKVWWLDDDQMTLIPKEEKEPWWVPYHTYHGLVDDWHDELPKYIPDKDMMHRPKYANQTVTKGALRYIYDENGDAHYEPKSMFDYDKDHGRV